MILTQNLQDKCGWLHFCKCDGIYIDTHELSEEKQNYFEKRSKCQKCGAHGKFIKQAYGVRNPFRGEQPALKTEFKCVQCKKDFIVFYTVNGNFNIIEENYLEE